MKKMSLLAAVIFLLISQDLFSQSFYTGAIGVTQSNGGRTRVFSDAQVTRQIDRTSILVGVSQTAVFDYEQDQQGIVNATTVTNPQLSDFEVTATLDNSYNNPPLPPNVETKLNIYGWTNGAYMLIKVNIKNREAAAMNARFGYEVIPQVDGAYGSEVIEWNAANSVVLIHKTKWVGYKIFSGQTSSLKAMNWFDGFATDSLFWAALTQNSFDPPITADPTDGGVAISGQAPVNIPAGGSVNAWYGIALGNSQQEVLANIALCEAKYYVTMPVELTSFTAVAHGNNVNINWTTATEINNQVFEVERRTAENPEWIMIGFKKGAGTSTVPQNYSLIDNISGLGSQKIYYRLKQVDFNGTATYFNEVEVLNNYAPDVFVLDQNYPNPFNPTTSISFGLPEKSNVSLKIYNTLGEKVVSIAEGQFEAGTYTINFNASSLPSGNYIYVLQTDKNVISKKMTLLK